MNNIIKLFLVTVLYFTCSDQSQASDILLKTEDIRIRDPFIYPDAKKKTYYMYAQSAHTEGNKLIAVVAYSSNDLLKWAPPKPVLTLPADAGINAFWAPEMHAYNGKFYLFVTLTYNTMLPEKKPVDNANWPAMHVRGTHIFCADDPLGPFKPFKNTSYTPEDWMALDGTLFVEDGTPYMVFCHEWVQLIDGTMEVVQLKNDLSDTVGKPKLLFKASDAPGAITEPNAGKVTDGCFLYRSPKSKKLFMIWSTFIPGSEYCVLLCESQSGKISGPWINQKLIYRNNGGHGMLFHSFDGRFLLALHQPNSGGMERLHLFVVEDKGDTLSIKDEVNLREVKPGEPSSEEQFPAIGAVNTAP